MQPPTCAIQHARTRRPFSLGIAVARASLTERCTSHGVCRLLLQIAAFGAPFMLLVAWACDRPLSLNFGLYQVSRDPSAAEAATPCGAALHVTSRGRAPDSAHAEKATALTALLHRNVPYGNVR